MTADRAAAYDAMRRAQGLLVRVTDRATLARIAAILTRPGSHKAPEVKS